MSGEQVSRVIENHHTNRDMLFDAAKDIEAMANLGNITDEERITMMRNACQIMNRECQFQNTEVEVLGTYLDFETDEDGDIEDIAIAPIDQPIAGYFREFTFARIPVVMYDVELGDRLVIVSRIHTGSESDMSPDGDVIETHHQLYVPVVGSKLEFTDRTMAHDINKLRVSENLTLQELDMIAYDDTTTLSQKLAAINRLYRSAGRAMDPSDRREFLSYLNSLDLLTSNTRDVMAEYALAFANDEVIHLRKDSDPVVGHFIFDGFHLGNQYAFVGNEVHELPFAGLALFGLLTKYEDSITYLSAIPLNQQIFIDEPSN